MVRSIRPIRRIALGLTVGLLALSVPNPAVANSDDSGRFVNGMLSAIAPKLRPGETPSA